MLEIKQSTANYDLVFYMVDDTDHVTPETGLSPTVEISKNGGAFASPSGAVSEISDGFYKVAANATDSNTLGMLTLRATATGADPVAMAFTVVANLEADTKSVVDSILTDTGTTLDGKIDTIDTVVDAIKIVTDALPDSGALSSMATASALATVDANVDAILVDTGTTIPAQITALNDLDAAGIRGAVGMASANLDTQLSAIVADTNELQTDNVPGLIAALNNLSAAQVNAEVDIALSDYDPPTKAEMDSGLSALNDPTAAAIADAVWDESISGHSTSGSTGEALGNANAPTAGQVADAVWDEALSGHTTSGTAGEAQNLIDDLVTSSITGAYSVTLTVTDGTNPLEGAKVRVAEGVTAEIYTTNASGQVTITRDAATYSIRITKAGYSFTETTRTVTGEESGTITNDLEMTAIASPSAPADPDSCLVEVYSDTLANVDSEGLRVTFRLNIFPSKANTVNEKSDNVMTITGGYGSITLRRTDAMTPAGCKYLVTCNELGLRSVPLTLDSSTYNLASLIV